MLVIAVLRMGATDFCGFVVLVLDACKIGVTDFCGIVILLPQIFHRNICGGTIAL